MRHLITFNEKFGVNFDIDKQVQAYFKEITDNKTVNQFNFVYHNDIGDFPFKVNIGGSKSKNDFGSYHYNRETGEKTIRVQKREDYATLLHEVKHLDYSTRNKEYYTDIFHWANYRLSNIKSIDPLKAIQNVFYLYGDNEFQSKFHGYYAEFDDFIKKYSSGKPTPSEIYNLFEKFLMSNRDNSWAWYFKDEDFKFEDYISKAQINRLFTQFIYKDDIYGEEYDSFIKSLVVGLKRTYKTRLNIYSKEELAAIERVKNFYEKKINKRLPKLRKKFLRLVTLMIDKWC